MSTVRMGAEPQVPHHPAQFRYGVVFLLIVTLLLFDIIAPEADWARSIVIALAGAALTVAVGTSRARGPIRRKRALVVGG
ncbi:MAG: hypothetical protein JO179_21880, partial [Solirubrobacterales bacterium]|nr:hypothetical protein [Solirubrobacterales bacterium]